MSERLDAQDRLADAPGNSGASRDQLRALVEQQAALRRVATLVARGSAAAEIFEAVTDELVHWLHMDNAGMLRYEGDGTATLLASRSEPGIDSLPIGMRVTLEGDNIPATVLKTGLPARQDSLEDTASSFNESIRELGIQSAIGVPIIIDGRVWGAIGTASSRPEPPPPDTEMLIGDFADLVATAIANAAARDQLRMLARQQAALRRVATLVAGGATPSEVFAAVAEEMVNCLQVDNAAVLRFEGDETGTFVAIHYQQGVKEDSLLGSRWTLTGNDLAAMILRTGRAARMGSYDHPTSPLAVRAHELGFRSAVGVPVVVDGRLWGCAGVLYSKPEPLPPDTEERLGDFAELVATAVANAATRDELIATRDELIASRARIVAAADDARRRLERDLHDGAQQRLVALGLQARMAEAAVPAELDVLRSQLSELASGLSAVSTELQEISRGIHPAILSEGGLGPALKSLGRRSAVPVTFDVALERRLPERVEVAAYYVVAEALTNAAKYAQATNVEVCAQVKEATLCLSIQDDGIGGADSGKGSGLIGLKDRVEVLGGHMNVITPPGSGTMLRVTIPLTG